MAKILLLGIGPLPLENPDTMYGACHRVWHFTRPLRDEGHQLLLLCMRLTDNRLPKFPPVVEKHFNRIKYLLVDEVSRFAQDKYVQQVHDEFAPDIIVGINAYPAARAAAIKTSAPLWADFHGYTMGEAQIKAQAFADNHFLFH